MYKLNTIFVLSMIYCCINTVSSGTCLAEKYFYGFQSDHSACASRANTASDYGVSQEDKTSILNHHNRLRASITDAANMQLMAWDDELAAIAQRWAEHCVYDHEVPATRRAVPGRFGTGQNLAYGYGDWAATVQAWFDEQKDFTYGSADRNNFLEIGHYTQIVWSTSTKVGCGFSRCSNLPSANYYVCNYGPAGNIGDWSVPYARTGSQCSQCLSNCISSGDYGGLCDCGGRTCYNGGTMDVYTCTCTCKAPHYLPDKDCLLDCGVVSDKWYCGDDGWDDCTLFSNIPSDCPSMCKFCPYASYKHVYNINDDPVGDSITLRPLYTPIVLLSITVLFIN